jgi:hypothetical protein
MAYRQKRQLRYDDLKAIGFEPYEAAILSKLPRSIPYLKEMARERAAEYSRFIRAGKTAAEFRTHILRRYNAKGWKTTNFSDPNTVWTMLRDYEKPYKERHPEYVRGYPKKSHHRDGEKTRRKLNGGLLESYKQELKSYGNVENDRTLTLKEMIRRMEEKGE